MRRRDAFGNPTAGEVVPFVIAAGNGRLVGDSAIADSSGVARVSQWTLGTTTGANQVTATWPGLAPVEFSRTGYALRSQAGRTASCDRRVAL